MKSFVKSLLIVSWGDIENVFYTGMVKSIIKNKSNDEYDGLWRVLSPGSLPIERSC